MASDFRKKVSHVGGSLALVLAKMEGRAKYTQHHLRVHSLTVLTSPLTPSLRCLRTPSLG